MLRGQVQQEPSINTITIIIIIIVAVVVTIAILAMAFPKSTPLQP
jgi:flagellar basal body-associated protein FliL